MSIETANVTIHNPHGADIESLPVIYAFNNGGSPGWLSGGIIAFNGTWLGGHVSSSEGYMLHDLGVKPGSRPDLHELFRTHFPGGYRMEFVSYDDVDDHAGLQAAVAIARSNEAP